MLAAVVASLEEENLSEAYEIYHVACASTNNEFVNRLVLAKYITLPEIEQIFRAVDRKFFYPRSRDPYDEAPCIVGNVHLSGATIYTNVLENLHLRKGMSFLNLGSGTGYLSSLAGLLLGRKGINHGVEIHENLVEYANRRVCKFMEESIALDYYDFCRPDFVVGNCLQILDSPQYDRVYCGACCTMDHIESFKRLLKIGGILIAPVDSELMLFKRKGNDNWEHRNLLPVGFVDLIPDKHPFRQKICLPQPKVFSLEELCVLSIRDILRKNVNAECPKLGLDETLAARLRKRRKRKSDEDVDEADRYDPILNYKRLKLPAFTDDSEDSSDDSSYCSYISSDFHSDFMDDFDESENSAVSKFSIVFRSKIKLLPLPKPLLVYLNRGKCL